MGEHKHCREEPIGLPRRPKINEEQGVGVVAKVEKKVMMSFLFVIEPAHWHQKEVFLQLF